MIDDEKHKPIYLIFKQKNSVKPRGGKKQIVKRTSSYSQRRILILTEGKEKKITAHLEMIYYYISNNYYMNNKPLQQ